jgi:hypothetical protein
MSGVYPTDPPLSRTERCDSNHSAWQDAETGSIGWQIRILHYWAQQFVLDKRAYGMSWHQKKDPNHS